MSQIRLDDYKEFFPSNWTPCDEYNTKLFKLIELEEDNDEYKEIKQLFNSEIPKKIERVQYPIAYLRYKVQSEYLQTKGYSVTEKKSYSNSMKRDNLEIYLSYNCENRLHPDAYCYSSGFNSHPNVKKDYCIVVINERNYCSISTDKNHYPLYVVEF